MPRLQHILTISLTSSCISSSIALIPLQRMHGLSIRLGKKNNQMSNQKANAFANPFVPTNFLIKPSVFLNLHLLIMNHGNTDPA